MKKYTKEYKEEAVKLWLESGRRSQEIGGQLGVRADRDQIEKARAVDRVNLLDKTKTRALTSVSA